MRKQDKYSSYAHLLEEETEGTDFTIHSLNRSDSGVIIIAPHGGKIEPGTDVIAREVAKNEFSFYTFNGIKTSNNRAYRKKLEDNQDLTNVVQLPFSKSK